MKIGGDNGDSICNNMKNNGDKNIKAGDGEVGGGGWCLKSADN